MYEDSETTRRGIWWRCLDNHSDGYVLYCFHFVTSISEEGAPGNGEILPAAQNMASIHLRKTTLRKSTAGGGIGDKALEYSDGWSSISLNWKSEIIGWIVERGNWALEYSEVQFAWIEYKLKSRNDGFWGREESSSCKHGGSQSEPVQHPAADPGTLTTVIILFKNHLTQIIGQLCSSQFSSLCKSQNNLRKVRKTKIRYW